MKLASIFGAYATRLQVVINTNLDRFAPLWYEQYFTMAPVQSTLTYEGIIGASRIEAAASVVDRDSQTPLRSRSELSKFSGEIPAIKEAFKMKESDYRSFLMMQALNVDDATKRTQLLNLLYGDIQKVGSAAHKRLDIMALEAVSTGKISLSITNNPDGLVLANSIDLLMPAGNKSNSTVSWDDATNAKPITDFDAVVTAARNVGRSFAKVLMTKTLFAKLRKAKEVVDTMTAFFYGPKPGGAFNPVAVSTLDRINEYLTANQLPVIELVDEAIGIESDGIISAIRPFSDNNVSFIPAGNLGTIRNAIAIEQMRPVDKVSYATYKSALISKWSDNEPFAEWTKVEFNAIPALDAIDGIFILTAVHA